MIAATPERRGTNEQLKSNSGAEHYCAGGGVFGIEFRPEPPLFIAFSY
jgi:hypothetical protein